VVAQTSAFVVIVGDASHGAYVISRPRSVHITVVRTRHIVDTGAPRVVDTG